MHWKGLRLVADGPKRQSANETQAQARRSEHLPRPSPPAIEPRLSEATHRALNLAPEHGVMEPPRGLEVPETEPNPGVTQTDLASSSHGEPQPNLRRNRFSFMRIRRASDPQLSKTYAKDGEDIPPVPSLPPPKIITTAPTSHDLDKPLKQQKEQQQQQQHKLRLLPSSRKHSMEHLPRRSTEIPEPRQEQKEQGSIDSQISDSALSASQHTTDNSGRLSITLLRNGSRDQLTDSHRSSVIDPRFSESSRSDQSYGEGPTFRTNSPSHALTSNAKRFRLPRLKRSPMFPLPPKPTTSYAQDHASKFSTERPKTSGSGDLDQISPLPSPSRSSVGLSSAAVPPLLRHDSTNSAHSVRSNPSHKGRGRSSTMGSVAENQDLPSPVPHMISSGRTSTSTTGRKSFGDLFGITQRLRQNSEPPFPRTASPGVGGFLTPTPKPEPNCPPRGEDDTPASYLTKLEEAIPRGMIASVLCQSDDEFFKVALRKYMRSFAYFGDPIDMSIRKLLMEVELPKETQQIDRFIQSFADRYFECNPGIFATTDQAYFIAFSILILHTDVFNKNNKRKMQKLDYVKNTRGEGISDDILGCFYENISYTPFIHVEDVEDAKDANNNRHLALAKPRRALFKSTSSEHLGRVTREPVDPYALILDNKLETLRPSLKDVMDLENTYDHVGTTGPPDINDLHQAFTKSGILQIVSLRSRPDAFMQGTLDPAESNPGLVDIKVAKVGLLWRKDPKKKRARSPWQEWGAILTFSQLYFFRNVTWVRALMTQYDTYVKDGRPDTLVFRPPLAEFKPDGIMSTHDAVALLDNSYKKHKHAFMFVRHNSVEEVFLSTSEAEMNDWLAKLNYAAAFRTTGVRTNGMIATNYEGQRYRKSQRMNSTTSIGSHNSTEKPRPHSAGIDIDTDVVAEFVAARRRLMSQKILETNEKLVENEKQLDELLRNARHLQVLTPVNSRARDGVILAAGRIAAKIKWVRQDISRNTCYRDVLLRDMGENIEGRAGSVAKMTSSDADTARVASISGPSITSDLGGPPRAPSIVRTVSSRDTNDYAAPSVSQPAQPTLLKQASTSEMRRPSIPSSISSSDAHVGRPPSISVISEQGNLFDNAGKVEREPSILSRNSKFDAASLSSHASKLASSAFDEGEERLLREAGLIDLNSSPPPRKLTDGDVEEKQDESSEVSPSEHKPSRVRRSLHRSLRDVPHVAHVPRHHSRSKKNRDSISSIGQLDDDTVPHDSEGLSRKTPSFTVHGKKASIVTFGSEWQNLPTEERLKLRKPTPHEEPRTSEPALVGSDGCIASDNIPSERPHSSGSTMTAFSVLSDDESADFFGPALENLPVSSSARRVTEPRDPADDAVMENFVFPRSTSEGLVHTSHLKASSDDRSTSSTSIPLTELAVDAPSSDNIREQAVGA
ncbi:hypothetical protein N7495_008715 [Penicillium taxi]|uniref:uncharacterized protein n=1 Tax=Penicillium taxi TaxID=168475 RepID=UPI0025455290|nr:uncharacterized protein N7495_008715 [Penicillium taxi]KAJ5888674.1 hypothetical protein N7495_008715 [Penicillium taxi]